MKRDCQAVRPISVVLCMEVALSSLALSALQTFPASATARGQEEIRDGGVVLEDDFESGDVSAWSDSVGFEPTQFMFCDGFETGDFNSEFWRPQAGSGGVVEVVSSIQGVGAPQSGVFGVAMGRGSDGAFTVNVLDLQLDLTGVAALDLDFWIRDFGDETQIEDGLFLSDDGGDNFAQILRFDPSSWSDAYGRLPPIALGRIAADLGLALNDRFVLRFQQADDDDFLGSSRDGMFFDDVKLRIPDTEFASLPYSTDFESGSLDSAWRWAFPEGTVPPGTVRPGGRVEVASSLEGVKVANRGLFGLALGRRSDGAFTSNAIDLHLNLEGESDVELRFWMRDNADETHAEDGIFLSDDGGFIFRKVYSFEPSAWSDSYGQLPPLDIGRLADENGLTLTDRFVIRFQQADDDDFLGSSRDGMFFDDVAVSSRPVAFSQLPLHDGFESGVLGASWSWGNATFPETTGLPGTVRPGGLVSVVSSLQGIDAARLGLFGVALGRRVDGGFTTNALDLHLDLAGQSQVELRFWIKDRSDDTDASDGLYFSPNGGETFRRAVDLLPSNYPNDVYQEIVVDIDLVAAGLGLPLTDRFVVRFQQAGDDDFTGSSADGFFIDDVSVAVP